jgi:hypothetical protein
VRPHLREVDILRGIFSRQESAVGHGLRVGALNEGEGDVDLADVAKPIGERNKCGENGASVLLAAVLARRLGDGVRAGKGLANAAQSIRAVFAVEWSETVQAWTRGCEKA